MTLEGVVEFLRSLWGLWLMVFFMGIVAYAFWPRNKDRLQGYGDIPLKDDEHEER